MQARMSNPAMIEPSALQALGTSAEQGGVPSQTLGRVQLRASQINAWNRLNVTTRQMAGSDPGFAAPDSAVIVTAEPEPDKLVWWNWKERYVI